MKIKKGDKVLIISGKDRTKTGTVERIISKKNKLIVSGINLIKKHLKPSRTQPKGGVVEQAAPIDISNVKLICGNCQKPTRVGYKTVKEGKKRVCRRCREII